MWLRCKSKWHWTYVQGHKEPETQVMRDGSEIHTLIEGWLRWGLIPPETRLGNAAKALIKHLPSPGSVIAESTFYCAPEALGFPVGFRGVIDMIDVTPAGLVVADHKTRSDVAKWSLGEHELRTDFQIRSYALVVARSVKWGGPVIVRHNNVERSNPWRTRIVETTLSPTDLDEHQSHCRATFTAMMLAADLPIEAIPYNTKACDDYKSFRNPDGCPHRWRCLALGRDVGGELAIYLNPETLRP